MTIQTSTNVPWDRRGSKGGSYEVRKNEDNDEDTVSVDESMDSSISSVDESIKLVSVVHDDRSIDSLDIKASLSESAMTDTDSTSAGTSSSPSESESESEPTEEISNANLLTQTSDTEEDELGANGVVDINDVEEHVEDYQVDVASAEDICSNSHGHPAYAETYLDLGAPISLDRSVSNTTVLRRDLGRSLRIASFVPRSQSNPTKGNSTSNASLLLPLNLRNLMRKERSGTSTRGSSSKGTGHSATINFTGEATAGILDKTVFTSVIDQDPKANEAIDTQSSAQFSDIINKKNSAVFSVGDSVAGQSSPEPQSKVVVGAIGGANDYGVIYNSPDKANDASTTEGDHLDESAAPSTDVQDPWPNPCSEKDGQGSSYQETFNIYDRTRDKGVNQSDDLTTLAQAPSRVCRSNSEQHQPCESLKAKIERSFSMGATSGLLWGNSISKDVIAVNKPQIKMSEPSQTQEKLPLWKRMKDKKLNLGYLCLFRRCTKLAPIKEEHEEKQEKEQKENPLKKPSDTTERSVLPTPSGLQNQLLGGQKVKKSDSRDSLLQILDHNESNDDLIMESLNSASESLEKEKSLLHCEMKGKDWLSEVASAESGKGGISKTLSSGTYEEDLTNAYSEGSSVFSSFNSYVAFARRGMQYDLFSCHYSSIPEDEDKREIYHTEDSRNGIQTVKHTPLDVQTKPRNLFSRLFCDLVEVLECSPGPIYKPEREDKVS